MIVVMKKGASREEIEHMIRRVEELGLKARVDKPNYLQRSFMACASSVDLGEAYLVGRAAVRAAMAGESDKMISLVRASSAPYQCGTGIVALSQVANRERKLPEAYVDRATGEITPAFVAYAGPLIGEPLVPYARLTAHYVERA